VQKSESKMLTTEEWTDVIEKGQHFKVPAIAIDRLDTLQEWRGRGQPSPHRISVELWRVERARPCGSALAIGKASLRAGQLQIRAEE
jgi:hypothetical protein